MGLILITASIISPSLTLLGVLPLDTARSAASKWRLEAEVNVLLRIQTDNEWWNVDNLNAERNELKQIFQEEQFTTSACNCYKLVWPACPTCDTCQDRLDSGWPRGSSSLSCFMTLTWFINASYKSSLSLFRILTWYQKYSRSFAFLDSYVVNS